MPKFYAGVDGGGSKTAAVILDERGQEVGRAQAGASNYQAVGQDAALIQVRTALAEALRQAGTDQADAPAVAVIGLAGLDRPADRALWEQALAAHPPLAGRVRLSNDAELILYALPDGCGLGLIAGTGSIALGRDFGGRRARAGGWGHFMGDEGSGLWLARHALNAASRASDGRGPQTALVTLILQEWNLAQPAEMIGVVYGGGINNTALAKLARVVFRAADDRDEVALALLDRAADELALVVEACAARLTFERPPGLAVAGGLLLHYPPFREAVRSRLLDRIPLGPLVKVPDPALVAAQAALTLSSLQ